MGVVAFTILLKARQTLQAPQYCALLDTLQKFLRFGNPAEALLL
jgi:hypothetical protein